MPTAASSTRSSPTSGSWTTRSTGSRTSGPSTPSYSSTSISDAHRGTFTQVLTALGLMDDPVNWFTNQWSFYAIVLLNVVHHGFPFVAITVLAGLLGVSKEMLEAAALDGAGAWRRF